MGLILITADKLLISPEQLWQLNLSDGNTAAGDGLLSGPWRLLLLGDGSPTRHLESLTGNPVEIELIAMAPEPAGPGTGAPPPPEIVELDGPLLRRQVWLRCGDKTLAWAESWWNQTQADSYLQQREQPIWRSLTANRSELFREVDGLALVDAPWLEQRFGLAGPFWSHPVALNLAGVSYASYRSIPNWPWSCGVTTGRPGHRGCP